MWYKWSVLWTLAFGYITEIAHKFSGSFQLSVSLLHIMLDIIRSIRFSQRPTHNDRRSSECYPTPSYIRPGTASMEARVEQIPPGFKQKLQPSDQNRTICKPIADCIPHIVTTNVWDEGAKWELERIATSYDIQFLNVLCLIRRGEKVYSISLGCQGTNRIAAEPVSEYDIDCISNKDGWVRVNSPLATTSLCFGRAFCKDRCVYIRGIEALPVSTVVFFIWTSKLPHPITLDQDIETLLDYIKVQ